MFGRILIFSSHMFVFLRFWPCVDLSFVFLTKDLYSLTLVVCTPCYVLTSNTRAIWRESFGEEMPAEAAAGSWIDMNAVRDKELREEFVSPGPVKPKPSQ